MTIKEFHKSVRELLNVGQQQYFAPEDLDAQINNAINDLYLQEYKHFEATQFISDTLGFFKKVETKTVTNNEAELPSDYYHMTELEAVLDDDTVIGCDVLKDSEFFNRKHSTDFAPSTRFPIARLNGSKKIEVLPVDGIKSVKIYYLRSPAKAVYGYEIDPGGTTWTYDAGSSVELDWPQVGHTMIQDKVISLLGLALRDQGLIASETVRKNQNEGR
jgi:hypothetical protein